MAEKPKTTVELEPGTYIVDVHPAHPPRIWKHDGTGLFTGHGGRIRRPSFADAITELIVAAERHEGIRP